MPRTADHAARRRQVATALVRVIASEGLDGASLRRVAAEAGTSVGLIQRYFTTKDDLLQFAFDHLYAQTQARLDAVDPSGPIGEVVHRALAAMLPLDAERAVENQTWVVFLAAAGSNPQLARAHREAMAEMHGRIAQAIAHAQRAGQADERLDAAFEAVLLTAFVDGLVLDMVSNPEVLTPELGQRALRAHLARVFRLDHRPDRPPSTQPKGPDER